MAIGNKDSSPGIENIILTDQDWADAHADAAIMEAKISELIEAFEQKHKPIQSNVVTRWRRYADKYIISKGGAAQVYLNQTHNRDGEIDVIMEEAPMKQSPWIVHSIP